MINVSAEERAYRAKHFHEIRAQRNRQLNCCSCGNELNAKAQNVFAHSIIGILQCEICYTNKEESSSSKKDILKCCCICGSSNKLCCCKNSTCQSAFCRGCIKRNASLSLLDLDQSNRWTCFVCETKPLWKLRGVCAIILDSQSGRNKRSDKCEKVRLSDQRHIYYKSDTMHRSKSIRASSSKKRVRISIAKCDITDSSDESIEDTGGTQSLQNKRKRQSEILSSSKSDSDNDQPSSSLLPNITQRKTKRKAAFHRNAKDEDSKSSSSHEFQQSKLTRASHSTLKKVSARNINTVSQPKTIQDKTKLTISEEQSFKFKLNVTEVLKKFKDRCWQFELKLDEIKCLNLRKDVKSLETANNISLEVTNIAKKFQVDLEDQCKELEYFHKSWTKNCLPSDEVSDTDESVSNNDITDDVIAHRDVDSEKEDEQKRKTTLEKDSDKSSKKEPNEASKSDQSVNKEPVTSELDSDVIFSETEEKNRPYVVRRAASYSPKASTMELHEIEKSISENDDSSSSTVQDGKKKASKQGSISGLSDETHKTIQHDETMANTTTVSSPSKITSDDDIFNDTGESNSTLILTAAINSSPTISNDVEVSETEGSSTNLIEESHPTLEAAKCSNDKEQDNVISVDETPDEKLVSDVISEAEMESELGSKAKSKSTAGAKSQTETKKKKTNKLTCSSHTKSMSDDNSDNVEEATKQALLDLSSDSDDLMDISFTTNNDSNKNSKPDDDCTVVASVNRKPCESEPDSATSREEDNCEDGTHKNKKKIKQSREDMDEHSDDRFSDISTSVRMAQKPVVYDYKLDKKYRSDKKLSMRCIVELRRLAKKHLRNYKKALKKSEEYLEHKKIESLVDVDKLERKSKKSTSTNSRAKDKAAKSKTNQKTSLNESSEAMDCIEEKLFSDSDGSDSVDKSKEAIEMSIENISDTDKIAKELLLDTSDSEIDGPKATVESSDNEQSKIKKKKLSSKKDLQKEDKSDEEDDNDSSKSKWRQDKMLTMKFSDSETEMEKERAKVAEKRNNKASDDEEDQTTQDESIIKKRHRRRGRKRVLLSDSDAKESKSSSDSESSDNSGSDKKTQKKKKKRCVNNSSDADSSEGEKKKKRIKRRRIKQMDSDSDSQKSDGSDNGKGDNLNSSQGSLGKKGRKNIRKVLKDTRVAEDTKQAAKEEEERQKRIADREKLYNELYEQRLAAEEKLEELVLDFNSETKQPLVSVHKEIVKHLKPHQAEGIRFMWNSCFESLERLQTSQGSGCIIAHCMGLGKTLQVIGLVHTLLMHDEIGINTVMIVSPLSTVLNWVNEINKWLKDTGDADDIEVYELTKMKTNVQRMYQLQSWKRTGGMLIIGYDMFRNLAGVNKNMRKNIKESILKCLVDPGPDLVVCDEGHLLKNEDTALSKCMNSIKTRRRIVLTGTPLQNNLVEYHCMVQFVKPSLLGTKQEFSNRFVNPINNGQYDDSTPYDVKLMKKRAYILNKMLKGSVQRFDYSVLTPFLPPKQEYVIFVSLSQVQIKLCQYYLDNFARQHRGGGGCLFSDFHALQRIWSHPLALQYNEEKLEKLNEKKLSGSETEGSLKDFINDDSEYGTSSTSSSDGEGEVEVKKNHRTRANKEAVDETINTEEKEPQPEEENDSNKTWWEQFVNPQHLEDMRVSGKLMLLFGILKECQKIGDKLLVFSQSLYTLRLIESFLRQVDSASSNSDSANYLCGHTGNWTLGADYFRLDGQTSPEHRNSWCKIFNKPTNTRARLFLISTKAGGLGINLTAANRVIIFDASWNPSQDMQSIFRIYRFGQKKPCYIYRFLAAGTMEEKIYNRQVTKLSLSCRVVDEQQIERHYTNNALNELYKFEPNLTGIKPTLNLPKDRLLADIFLEYKDYVENYHEHDSLLENKTEEELDEDERKQAWLEYEEEKKGKPRQVVPMLPQQILPNNVFANQFDLLTSVSNTELHNLQELIRKDYPNISTEQQKQIAMRKLIDMYSYVERQVVHGRFTGNFTLPNTQQVNGPIFVQQPQQQQLLQQPLQRPQLQPPQQQALQRPQQQETRNDREVVVNPYAYGSVGSSASRQTVDNDVIEINSVDTAVQVQNPPQSINRNQEE